MIFVPKKLFKPSYVLYIFARSLHYSYCLYGSMTERDWKQPRYAESIDDWTNWLRLAEHVLAHAMDPTEFINVARGMQGSPFGKRSAYPLPEDLFAARYIEKYQEWLSEEASSGSTTNCMFRLSIQQIMERTKLMVLHDFDQYFEDPPEDEIERLVLGFLYRNHSSLIFDRTKRFEEYLMAHVLKIQDRACDVEMFCHAVLEYYPHRKIYSVYRDPKLQEEIFGFLARFFEEFDPIAEKSYLKMCDMCDVDFSDVEKKLLAKLNSAKPVDA